MHREQIFQKHSLIPPWTRSNLSPYHQLSIWLSYCNLCGQGRAHMPCGCTRSFSTLNISNPFVPGWLSTSVIHKVNHRHGTCVTTQHKPSYHSTQVIHSLSCFINQKHKSKDSKISIA